MVERGGAYRVLLEKREGRSPLGGHRIRREDNSKMDFREVGGVGRDRWRALVNAVMNF
jgi:hypothetical protein